MKPNPQKGKIILVDHTEVDAGGRGSYLKIFDTNGTIYRIAEKRSNLWEIFKNARKYEPVLAIFETYNNVEYIADARPITDDLMKLRVLTSKMKKIMIFSSKSAVNRQKILSTLKGYDK